MRDRGWTLAQVGKIFGVSRERIRQRERAERRRRQAAQVVLEAGEVRG
jgi:DNA-directed RNA polymerase sigma subunit (sigma70/sigma32)